MFGKIININEKTAVVENLLKRIETGLINIHVIFEYNGIRVVGQIHEMDSETITINFVGEIENDKLKLGIVKIPNINSKIRVIYENEINFVLGNQNFKSKDVTLLGKSVTYPKFNVTIPTNGFFGSHFAILGNTGSGKSCGVARLLQNIYYNKESIPLNSRIVMFDAYGEYHSAFTKVEQFPGIHVKNLVTNLNTLAPTDEIIKIPPYLLEVDDLALLLNVDNPNQLPIIEKALNLVYIFTEDESMVIKNKNYIIAKSLLDILSSGRTPTQIRDQIVAVLTTFKTNDINLETKIVQPGYIRTIRQCLNIDPTGKINTISLVVEYLSKFTEEDLSDVTFKRTAYYSLQDLYNAFEFALISEGVLKSDKVFDTANILKVRLDTLIKSSNAEFFQTDTASSIEDYVNKLFLTEAGEPVQILNVNFDSIDERFAKALTKIYSKFFWKYAVSLDDAERAKHPINIIVEEAHRYVQNDRDIEILGYNIFDRITKEGRKYGVLLGLITQRPSELSVTALSQCSNFMVFRLYHPDDLQIISKISTNVSEELIEKLKTLRPGTALGFGSSFSLTNFIQFEYPNPAPASTNSDITNIWYGNNTNAQ